MRESPIAAGAGLAVLAALSFGVTIPIVERAGRGVGSFTTAALLYAGAGISAVVLARLSRPAGAPLRRAQMGTLGMMAVMGACVAPTLLAWGLQHAGALTGSLLLNFEAAFTVAFAWAFYREPIGRRVAVALALMTAGGVALAISVESRPGWSLLGALATAGATAAWAIDNTLSRRLAEQDPVRVVAAKGGLGALLTVGGALTVGEHLPSPRAVLLLLACGATGYGLSLRLYLLAQRRIGAARSASIFAIAPFIGAAVAWGLGDRSLGVWTGVSAALFGLGVYLHATEHHGHRHVHPAVEHEHAHRHDDGHHTHLHDPAVLGEHSHPHRHDYADHDHAHAPDVHHEHVHP